MLDAAKPYGTESLLPDIEAPQTLADYLAGKDTAVETILARTDDAGQPQTALTRAALATALGRDYAAQTGQGIQTQQPPFADVSVFHYAAPYIGWAQAAGLLYGDSNEVFAPDRAVTRAELAAVLTRYAALCGKELTAKPAAPTDADAIAAWARDAACQLADAGVLPLENGKFQPSQTVSRTDFDAILANFTAALT